MSKLVEERLAIHWAAQILAGAAIARIEAVPDFSHTNLGYDAAHRALMTHPIGDVAVGLVLAEQTLIVATEDEVAARFPLAGKTLEEGMTWLAGELDRRAGDEVAIRLPEHDMPAHPAKGGAPFAAPTAAYGEVADWFAVAHEVVSAAAAAAGDAASPARCWPHHFDLATLITVEAHEDPEEAKSVGFGMTPGDEGIPEPYFYATPWPKPDPSALGELSVGAWHTDGWIGAVLTSVDRDEATEFAKVAVAACRALV